MKVDMSEVRGMPEVVRAIEDAVLHMRSLLLCGPPGIGKTMVARRIPTIMEPLSDTQRAELTEIYRQINLLSEGEEAGLQPPFRAPHHTVSGAALAGNDKRPGELDLARYGVLFLDELPEFGGVALDRLAKHPRRSKCLIIATAVPCPCGWNSVSSHPRTCTCPWDSVFRFRTRTAKACMQLGIQHYIDLPDYTQDLLAAREPGDSSEVIRARIRARRNP